MTTKRKHSSAEIAAMLAQANEMAAQGKLQSDIAKTLGISADDLAPMAQGNTCASSTDQAFRGRGWSEPTNIRATAREFTLATPSDGFAARKNEPGGVDQRGEVASRPKRAIGESW